VEKTAIKTNFWERAFWWFSALALIAPVFATRHIVMGLGFIKLTIFEILIELALAVYLILWGFDPQKYRPRFSWLTVAVLIFGLVLVLATIFSLQPYPSFWGSTNRLNGLFAYFHYFGFFFVLSWGLHTKQQWLRLLQVAIFASLIPALYGLFQYLGVSFVLEPAEGGRIVGTLSNPIFLAEYLMLLFFPALLYGLKAKSRLLKALLLITALLQAVVIFLTGSRGAVLALVVGFIVFVFSYLWLYRRRWLSWGALIAGVILLLGSLSVWQLRQLPSIDNYILKRLTTFELSDFSFQNRLHTWKIAWKAWPERPVLGYGLENFAIAFQKHYQPFAEKFSNAETWFDRAHNGFLDYLVMTGWLGLLAYLFLIGIAFWRALVVVFNKAKPFWQRHLSVALIGLLIAYMVFNLSAFDMVPAYIVFFFLLALLNSFDTKKGEGLKPARFKWLAYLAAVLVLFVLLPIQWKNILADRTGGYAVAAFYKKDFEKSFALLDRSVKQSVFVGNAVRNKLIVAAQEFIRETAQPEEQLAGLVRIADDFEKSFAYFPLSGKHRNVLGAYYSQIVNLAPQYLPKAEELSREATELAPRRPFIYLNWGSAYTNAHQDQKALQKYQEALQIYPNLPVAHFWAGFGHIRAKQIVQGEKFLLKAEELGFSFDEKALKTLANSFEYIKDYPRAELTYKQLIGIAGNKFQTYYETISFYHRVGWYRKAYSLAKSYLEKNPGDKAMLGLVEELRKKAPYLPPL